MEGFITHHHEKAGSSEKFIGLGERKYGRKSLRSVSPEPPNPNPYPNPNLNPNPNPNPDPNSKT